MVNPKWLSGGWGIVRDRGTWCVCYGDDEQFAFSGRYRNRRRAKTEVRYILAGAYRGPFHGVNRVIKEVGRG